MSRLRSLILAVTLTLPLLAGIGQQAEAQRSQAAPEAGTGRTERPLQRARSFMVSAANPLAVDAGVEMLKAGGSAADAAVAVQLVLNLVEPQSSGLGGGAYVLHWDARGEQISAYDGREAAPAAVTADRFVADGKPMPFDMAVHSGLSVGVPGTPRLLETLHRAHGRLSWRQLFEPALRLAVNGFPVSPRLNQLLREMGPARFEQSARAYFFGADAIAHPVGHLLANPAFVATLEAFRDGGVDGFYKGAPGREIIDAVARAPRGAAIITPADLESYRVELRNPACVLYRLHRVCSMGPSSSGGITIGQTLKMLERFDLGTGAAAAEDPAVLHLIAEAEKLAYADRDRYIADPAFVRVPSGMLDSGYLGPRSRLIDPEKAAPRPRPGRPPGVDARLFGIDGTRESNGTSHISIVDGDGNAVSMTTTIEAGFGSRIMAAGFLLNNELTDFAFQPRDAEGREVANAAAPGKRPRSSMAPTLVFDPSGRLLAVLGSPGGSRIILYVVKAIVALIDWKLDAQAAAAIMNFGSRGGDFEIEAGSAPQTMAIIERLRVLGHRVAVEEMTSGHNIVVVRPDGLEGGSDPRREGIAKGD